MRVSAKVDYALRACVELAVAAGDGPVKGERIAQAQGVPLKFLENILLDLRHAGLVQSQRGAEGGYWLALPPAEVSLADVIRAVEGPIANVRGVRPEQVEYDGAARPLQDVWIALRASMRAVLEDVTRRRIALPERGVEIALLDWGGAGPLALLHHANGFCAATLDLVARLLRAHFRVIGMDARGHGDSSRPATADAYEWREFGADLAAVARVLAGDRGRVALGLGHSFGGTSMLLAAAEEPALFERLVLVDPVLHEPRGTHHYDTARHERASEMVQRATRRRAVFPDRAAARENWRGKDMFAEWDPRAFDLYLAEAIGDRSDGPVELKCRPETEAAVYMAGFTSNVWDPTEKLAVPTLILWAQRGNFPRSVYEAYVRHIGDARIQDVDAGHLMAMERPELVVDAALAFAGTRGR